MVNKIEITKNRDVIYEIQLVQKQGLTLVGAACVAM